MIGDNFSRVKLTDMNLPERFNVRCKRLTADAYVRCWERVNTILVSRGRRKDMSCIVRLACLMALLIHTIPAVARIMSALSRPLLWAQD
jgi:hypothetical protein